MQTQINPGLLLIFCLCSVAEAATEWTTVRLAPLSHHDSYAHAVFGEVQVGWDGDELGGGALWHGSQNFTPLLPSIPGTYYCEAYDVFATQQVGYAWAGRNRAALWSGSAGTHVDLHPQGASNSWASGTDSEQQVGTVVWPTPSAPDYGYEHAALWSGLVASYVDLNPTGAEASQANAVYGGHQVGWAAGVGVVSGAAIWSGTAESVRSLHPQGSDFLWSEALDIHEGTQVGMVQRFANSTRPSASLWHDTADSWTDLAPAGSLTSTATGVWNGFQVGWAEFAGTYKHAGIWNGSAESFFDLHSLVSDSFIETVASGVWHDGATIYVVGTGITADGEYAAMMWVGTVPEPSTACLLATAIGSRLLRRRRSIC